MRHPSRAAHQARHRHVQTIPSSPPCRGLPPPQIGFVPKFSSLRPPLHPADATIPLSAGILSHPVRNWLRSEILFPPRRPLASQTRYPPRPQAYTLPGPNPRKLASFRNSLPTAALTPRHTRSLHPRPALAPPVARNWLRSEILCRRHARRAASSPLRATLIS